MKKFIFVLDNIYELNSGTEFSVMNRYKLFKKFNLNTIIVTLKYNTSLHLNMCKYQIDKNDLINMYDFFQKVTNQKKSSKKLRFSETIDKNHYKINYVNGNYSNITKMGKLCSKVNIFPGTFGEMGVVEHYDNFGNISSKDIWDSRGFKSKTQYMHPNGRLGHEYLYDINSKPVLEITHMNKDNDLPTMFKLLDYHGRDYRFDTELELFTFFLSELSKQNDCVIINDMAYLADSVGNTSGALAKYHYLHFNHIENPENNDAIQGNIKSFLAPVFNNAFKYNGLIVNTEKQKDDLKSRFPKLNVISIYDNSLFDELLPPMSLKVKNNLTYMGMISPNENIDQIIQIVKNVKKYVPDICLNIAGYSNDNEYENKLKNDVKNLNLENNVKFLGYLTDEEKKRLLIDTKIMLQTSYSEGLGDSMLEALPYGIVNIAYNVNYGANEIIKNGYNGYLIDINHVNQMGIRISKLLQDKKLFNEMSINSINSGKKFNYINVFNQWKKLIHPFLTSK
ncbi:glycosyltransferase [Apilactobacillus xinyiensis]|uniref:glycosyltransferase n=1 Tax=Apilactobacillus xinyiensis TaxID=2841032 RepID=UPI00200C7ACF|nr:glycosyltransferase [Apilactobacillus xinyiensis]MCL0330785.1 glycosyltransferase [Apilactobacillus xinyiensis]